MDIENKQAIAAYTFVLVAMLYVALSVAQADFVYLVASSVTMYVMVVYLIVGDLIAKHRRIAKIST